MTYIQSVLIMLIFVLGLSLQLAKTELCVELVQVLFRHGERTPREKEMWPNDPYNVSTYEPWGLAQMTNQGKMREYRIGQMLRERYDEFLGDIYHPSDVYAVSTDIDRTKMSLQLVLAALYHPAPIQTWNEKLPWLPIPTHYMPEKVDNLMKPEFCALYSKALMKVRNLQEVIDKVSAYKVLFKFLTEKTGMNITSPSQVYEIYNLLIAQKSMDLVLPEWCTDEVYKEMQDVLKLEYEIRSYTPQLRRLHGGMLVRRFIENMKLNEARTRQRKIYLYSGHEINISGFIKAHNLTEPELPPYGCAIIVEKLRDKTGKKFIRMLLWTGSTEELIPYKLADDEICPIDKYLQMTQEVIPSEEEWNYMWDNISKEELKTLYEEKLNLN